MSPTDDARWLAKENGMKHLKTYTACPRCGQALELSPGAVDEITDAVAQAVKETSEALEATAKDAIKYQDLSKQQAEKIARLRVEIARAKAEAQYWKERRVTEVDALRAETPRREPKEGSNG